MKNVIIVESPSKSKTIESYMGSNYKVLSSVGHIRDLATTGKDGLGIDIENNFAPDYRIIKGKEKLVKDLQAECKNAHVYLATDPDREGEAISYHLAEILGLKEEDYDRIEFHEITRPAVLDAFSKPRKIDYDLVYSQETRRMLDRIIGFKVSKLLKVKIKSKSAGRVQSVALKLICDLEREIENFISTPYYEIEALFDDFKLDLVSYKGNKDTIVSYELAQEIVNSLNDQFVVFNKEEKEIIRNSKPAYTTSTLQQDAVNKLNYQSTRTMRIAQSLYEGKEIGNEHIGLITYMRTDSTRLSDVFVKETKKYIQNEYGKEYVGGGRTRAQKLAQDAHEAIRVTSIYRTPKLMKPYLSSEEYQLYKLIYNRTITSLMSSAKFSKTTVFFSNNETLWKTASQTLLFDGYLKVYGKDEDDENIIIPEFNIGNSYIPQKVEINELFTKPKSRYTEASLIKDMEELGIGRPSTYAQTLSVLKERSYIKVDKKSLIPTEQGKLTNDALADYFSDIINVKYTANMEGNLDKISKGQLDSKDELNRFYSDFNPICENAWKNMEKIGPVLTEETCPNCGSLLAVRKSKFGEFLACSNYPKCKYIKPNESKEEETPDVDTGIICPKCGTGHILEKTAKTGKNKGNKFYACSNYPRCKNVYNDLPTNELCPNCGSIMLKGEKGLYCSKKCDESSNISCPKCQTGFLVKKLATKGKNKGNYFYSCDNFPKCKTIYNDEPLVEKCPRCQSMLLKDKNNVIYCSDLNCGYKA